MRVVHVYTMRREPERIRTVAPKHAAYWRGLDLPGYLGGPLDDRSSGVISFEADALEDAQELVDADPFVLEELLESSHLGRWLVDEG